ncbi:GtrA family protein [Kineococcus rhizosphaerae]|uniref:Putative flippase GtrA n=1 Tax=Kineococcus rhizosphaerae TaxID=559628 RepID=A0A2T0R0F0_9ACTN|nr:GtrA family protein [Kineococcus rhizosphaerae]PRY12574.1 putative flippase GtrA [Kineococcus rhizosphaerae]
MIRAVTQHHRFGEVVRFLVSGGIAYLADLLVFNVLLFAGVGSVWSKVVSSVVAIFIAFLGSRYYTWRDRRSEHPGREYAMFFLFSAIAAGLQLLCLAITHYGFGWTSVLADNVSGNVVGMAIAMVFRFYTFRTFVFPARAQP